MQVNKTISRGLITDIILLCLIVGSIYTFMLGSRPLNVPDEARYCEIPREMLVTHQFITPHINGVKYFEKPPLFYWMQAATFKAFGLSEWSCRLTDMLMGLLGILLTYLTARKLYDRQTGIFASIVLASSFLYYGMAHVVTLDMSVSIFLTLCLFCFILGSQYPPSSQRRIYFYLMYIAAALAVMTKGLIGIVIPGGIVFFWMLFTKQFRTLKDCYIPTGLILFLLITLPWHILVQKSNPEFFHFYFIDQHFLRYFTKDAGRYHPIWAYVPILLLGIFPWTGFLYRAIKQVSKPHTTDLFFLIWAIFVFIFFSISDSKLVPYILPCFPPLAILIARYFTSHPKDKLGYGTICFITIILAIAIPIGFQFVPITDPIAKTYAYIIMSILFLNALIVPWLFSHKGFMAGFIGQLIFSTLFVFALSAISPYIYTDSIKPLANKLNTLLKPTDRVVTYDFYYQDLPFYLRRLVTIVNWHGELRFGSEHQDTSNLMISDKQFWPLWNSSQMVYMMLDHKIYKKIQTKYPNETFYPIMKWETDMLVANHQDQT